MLLVESSTGIEIGPDDSIVSLGLENNILAQIRVRSADDDDDVAGSNFVADIEW